MEELLQQESKDFFGWKSSSQESSTLMTRTSVNTITLYGYSSKVSNGSKKVIISRNLADLMGIARQIYVMENVIAYQDIRIENLGITSFFTTANSPLCGIEPNSTDPNYVRGYSSSSPDDDGNIKLATRCIHVISDLSGRNYDLWYPCKPEEVQWKYNLLNL